MLFFFCSCCSSLLTLLLFVISPFMADGPENLSLGRVISWMCPCWMRGSSSPPSSSLSPTTIFEFAFLRIVSFLYTCNFPFSSPSYLWAVIFFSVLVKNDIFSWCVSRLFDTSQWAFGEEEEEEEEDDTVKVFLLLLLLRHFFTAIKETCREGERRDMYISLKKPTLYGGETPLYTHVVVVGSGGSDTRVTTPSVLTFSSSALLNASSCHSATFSSSSSYSCVVVVPLRGTKWTLVKKKLLVSASGSFFFFLLLLFRFLSVVQWSHPWHFGRF